MSVTFSEVPLSGLSVSEANVRKSRGDTEAHTQLVASIRAHGLLNPLVIKPDGAVIAGGRRLRALQELYPASYLVPCQIIKDADAEVSLTENISRAAMHPLDEFEAFASLAEQGQSVSDIALRFGVSEHHIKQRLRLGRIAEPIRAACRAGELDLDVLTAFAVTEDQNRQLALFEGQNFYPTYHYIRNALTDSTMESSDTLAEFVGMDAYKAAGGTYTEDLFSEVENRYILDDPALVQELAEAKLEEQTESLRNAGWKWVEARVSFEYWSTSKEFPKRLYPDGNADFTPEQKAESGCIVTVDYHGKIKVEAGLQRKDDFEPEVDTNNPSGYPQSLRDFLKNQRLAILSRNVAKDSDLCLDLIIHALVGQYLQNSHRYPVSKPLNLTTSNGIVGDNAIINKMLPNFPEGWDYRIFLNEDNSLEYISDLSKEQKGELLGFCTAMLIQHDGREDTEEVLCHIAERTDIQPEQVWRPTSENFWSKLKKSQILDIATEVLGQDWSDGHSKTKKSELAELMEYIFRGEEVLGIRPDQQARAKQWIPEAMTFGTLPELPELTEPDHQSRTFTIDVDETEGLACTETTEPEQQPEEPKCTVTKARLIPTREGGYEAIPVPIDTDTGEELPSVFMA